MVRASLEQQLAALSCPAGVRFGARYLQERSELLALRNGRLQPLRIQVDRGVMLTVQWQGGQAYAATSDLSQGSLQDCFSRALELAKRSASWHLLRTIGSDANAPPANTTLRTFTSPPDELLALRQQTLALLREQDQIMGSHPEIMEREASVQMTRSRRIVYRGDAQAVHCLLDEERNYCVPHLQATAQIDGVTQTRSLAGRYNGFCQQGAWDVIERGGLHTAGERIAREAIALARAPQCPQATLDLLLAPDQMMLQIHESIGHPLELDRILGDERNFAGGSFVTPDMFGHYDYGSALLNVTVGPQLDQEFASFLSDDEGVDSTPVHLIEHGRLLRPLGSAQSAARATATGFPVQAVACARSSGWDRPPIDRMPNLNIEPGESTLQSMIKACRRGIYLKTNLSWSIDDRRDKFQFGCEYGQLIEDGELTTVVRNPNYRGRSASFWRSLAMVGNEQTREIMGTPFCGKGEPGQVIRVGHASPACLFTGVEVFGGSA